MRVLCEMSGGADSALAAIYAKRKYPEAKFFGLFVGYEQPYAGQERAASRFLTEKIFGTSYDWLSVHMEGLFSDEWEDQSVAAQEYFPVRNLVLTSIAASTAVRYGCEVIVTGSKSFSRVPNDPYSFRDSTLPFYALMEAAINGALESGRISVEPLLAMGRDKKMGKRQVYEELLAAGIHPMECWSCYHPTATGKECGSCRNCKEKEWTKGYLPADAD